MATVLQQQLAAIASKSTHQLHLKAQRGQHSKSLLFEPKDAANQTFETIYQICAEGFQDLCLLDARFAPFAGNLFSEQSKSEDRTQMTAQENEELDKVIQSFLGLVAGRLLLRPGLKAVEWLVRRFRAHEYNTDWLLLTFLPYHSQPVFATLLSIVPKQLSPTFRFLQPYVTSLTSPPRHAILYTAINNPGLFSALNQYTLTVARQGHQSANSLGFWASIVAQAINGQLDAAQSGRADIRRQREEDLLLRVIPVLQEALQIRNVPELYLGSCMIIAILVTKTQLEDRVLNSLMDSVVKSWSTSTAADGLTCLSVIAEERQTLKLPRTTAKVLLATQNIKEQLVLLSQKHQTGRLYMGLVLHAIEDSNFQVESLELVDDFLQLAHINDQRKVIVLGSLGRTAMQSNNARSTVEWRDRLSQLFTALAESANVSSLLMSALAQEDLGIEDLEVRLQVPLQLPASMEPQGDQQDEDVVMVDNGSTDTDAIAREALASLPKSLGKDASFLATNDTVSFEKFAKAFLLLTRSSAETEELLQKAGFQRKDAATTPVFLSFLMRLWSSNIPAVTRANALKIATETVRGFSEQPLDMQAVIPYVLIGLADLSQNVRRAASELAVAMTALYQASGEKGKVPVKVKIWCQESIYEAASTEVKWLSSQDAYKILSSMIVPSLEECLLDSTHIRRVIVDSIDASSGATELKSALRSALFAFVASHASISPVCNARTHLLPILARSGKAGSAGRVQVVIPAVQKWTSMPDDARVAFCSGQGTQPAELDRMYIDCISSRTSEEIECLKVLARSDKVNVMEYVFNRIQHIWSSMKPPTQAMVAPFLLDLSLESGDESMLQLRQTEALDVLRRVTLSTEVLITFLDSVPDIAQMPDKPSSAKRRRTSRSETTKAQTSANDLQKIVRRLTLVLELIEASKPERHSELLKGLFHVLGELQQYRTHVGSDLVYLQQMVISSLLDIVESLKSTSTAKPDRSVLRADLIVECVRSTSSTQLHNAGLLLISSLASWAPDLVLHSVMPIFTFMSTTILRQSDDYSAHIIDQTVSRVVPPLVASLRKKNQDLVTGAAELLLSFTAAFEHIPLHRRLRLFNHLVNALGPDASLPAIVAMLFEKYPTDRRVPQFTSELMLQFPALTQLKAAAAYLDLVADALQPRRTTSEAVFGFNDKSKDQIEHSLEHLLFSMSKLLQQRQLQHQISKVLSDDSNADGAIHSASGALLEKSLKLAKSVEGRESLGLASGTVVAACLGLLPTPDFVRSALPLLDRPDNDLRLKVLQSLERRAESAKPSQDATRVSMFDALSSITRIIESSDNVAVKHSAITCVDHIAEKFGKKDPTAILQATQVIASDAALGSSGHALQIISLLCLSSGVEILRDDMVPIVPSSLNKALDYLSTAVTDSANERLHDAVYTFAGAILEHLPWIFSAKVLEKLLTLTYQAAVNPDLGARSTQAREQFTVLAARKLDMKVFLSALDGTLDVAVARGALGCNELLSILQKLVATQTKAILLRNASPLLTLLNRTFDLRRLLSQSSDAPDEEELQALDQSRDGIMLDSIMKLNDSSFRPFFVRLVEWATAGLPKKDKEGRSLRLVSLYGFLARFFASLKSIVTSYSTYILEDAAATLKKITPKADGELLLVREMLDALSSSFKHDQEDFWQAPSHFGAISEALLAQLAHSKDPSTRDTIQIIPTITELAIAAGSPDHHKELNASLLKSLRADDALVRLAAVKCEQSLTEKLGEDWLSLLPEMLPFISELQEDDDEVVEKETLTWIRQIEGILGESLEGMLQ